MSVDDAAMPSIALTAYTLVFLHFLLSNDVLILRNEGVQCGG
jgi:hypothetical protein